MNGGFTRAQRAALVAFFKAFEAKNGAEQTYRECGGSFGRKEAMLTALDTFEAAVREAARVFAEK